jgi:hypothetical protein
MTNNAIKTENISTTSLSANSGSEQVLNSNNDESMLISRTPFEPSVHPNCDMYRISLRWPTVRNKGGTAKYFGNNITYLIFPGLVNPSCDTIQTLFAMAEIVGEYETSTVTIKQISAEYRKTVNVLMQYLKGVHAEDVRN